MTSRVPVYSRRFQGLGSGAGQKLCATPMQGCLEYVSQITPGGIPVATDVPLGTTSGKNVFQGIVNGNAVTFFGIPVLSPGSGTRVLRITNVHANANPLSGLPGSIAPLQASLSITGATSLLLSDPAPIVGFVSGSLTASANIGASLGQCTPQTMAPAGTLTFGENFSAAFRTRVMAQSNAAYAGQTGTPGQNGFVAQNVPGLVYNSESGLVLPVATGQTAGLADFGTRLKAVFNNVPAGVHLFVRFRMFLTAGCRYRCRLYPAGLRPTRAPPASRN